MSEPTLADAAHLASRYADQLLVGTTRDVHRAIASRVLTLTRQQHTPVGLLYDTITGGVYGGVGLATRALGRMGELGIGTSTDLERTQRGRRLRSVVNGLSGDVLRDQGHPAAITASFRLGGRDLELHHGALRTAYPDATERVVVFVHGLCEDEDCWSYHRADRGPTYLERLRGKGRWTPLAVRLNSGVPIQHNAVELVALVDRLVDAWPRDVHEIAFVGHSLGGLVVRAAADPASRSPWSDRVSHVVLLGSPHGGAPLERLVKRAVPAMQRLPEVAPFATILEERSVGIRDLHDGIGVDAALWPDATYHCVGATLGKDERSLAGRMFGDLLVLLHSAQGSGAKVDADFRRITSAHHFDLLNHPLIHADLARWLGEPVAADLGPVVAAAPGPTPVDQIF
ncbi:MAG: alpha/beta fold hydrolase [Actinomycetota bacterium]|nr:alpha/beta fold hydrolase [Actinomycetota bacterium]